MSNATTVLHKNVFLVNLQVCTYKYNSIYIQYNEILSHPFFYVGCVDNDSVIAVSDWKTCLLAYLCSLCCK